MVILIFLIGLSKGDGFSDDHDLWASFLAGDKDAISQLFLRYYDDLYLYGLSINPSEDAIKDCIQELFLRLWEKRDFLSRVNSVKKYLLVSLRRIVIRQLDNYNAREIRQNEYLKTTRQIESNPEDEIINIEVENEREDLFRRALSTLTERQRETLFFKYYEGFENKEIADIMDISYQRVRNLLHESIERLRDYIH